MATATAIVTISAYPNGVDNTLRHEVVFGTLAVQASPATYVTNGLPVTFDSASREKIKANTLVAVWGDIAGVSGFFYQYDVVRKTLRIYQQDGTTGKLTELANASAIPAGVSGDTIQVRFEFNRGI